MAETSDISENDAKILINISPVPNQPVVQNTFSISQFSFVRSPYSSLLFLLSFLEGPEKYSSVKACMVYKVGFLMMK